MLKVIALFLCSTILIFSFQNCSQTQFSKSTDIIDGSLSIPCQQNKKLSVYSVINGEENYVGDVIVYTGELTALENYNYYSASTHPIYGPQPTAKQFVTYFYENSEGIYLNFYSNKDNSTETARFDINIQTTGNNNKDDIVFFDDPLYITQSGNSYKDNLVKTMDGNMQNYIGTFAYKKNTDGGVIGPFSGETFEIAVSISEKLLNQNIIYQIDGAKFYSSDGSSFILGEAPINNLSFKFKFGGYFSCITQ